MKHLVILDVLTSVALAGGLFFLLVGALGVLRLPDVYLRMIAASKCITLGITGMLLAAVFHFTAIGTSTVADGGTGRSSAVAASTKAILVILFQFVAGPVGTFMLARSAHIDRVRLWKGTLSDDLSDDTAAPPRRPEPHDR